MTEPARVRTRTLGQPVAPEPPALRPIEERQPGITAIMNSVAERMGPNVMQRATAVPGFAQIETGVFLLDYALLGGFPEGLVSMIFGYESSGKTTLAKRVAGNIQRKYPDRAAVFIDLEQTYDNNWGAVHHVDNERLILSRPESGEHAVDIVDAVVRCEDTAIVILDSLPAIVPMAEIESSAEDFLVAARARLISKLCHKLLTGQQESRNKYGFAPTVLLINQYRANIGGGPKASPNSLPCGRQSRYISTTMVEVKGREIMGRNSRGNEIVSHNDMAFTIKKSRVGNSLRQGEFAMVRDHEHPLGVGAINDMHVVREYAKRFGIVAGGGASWRIEGLDRKFGKLAEIDQFLAEQPDELLDLKRRILMVQRSEMGLRPVPPDGYLLGYLET